MVVTRIWVCGVEEGGVQSVVCSGTTVVPGLRGSNSLSLLLQIQEKGLCLDHLSLHFAAAIVNGGDDNDHHHHRKQGSNLGFVNGK